MHNRDVFNRLMTGKVGHFLDEWSENNMSSNEAIKAILAYWIAGNRDISMFDRSLLEVKQSNSLQFKD